ncbi:sensor histidine kinase [Geobacter sp. SVR]|uniref:sensor histidine kinase n=1 Tax=Geobacter sp. SVR TaxID=2495594 RepID=UPI00143EF57B|nr:ATP-binding protein [Geobacter sp. SVR]BCS53476.1 two-component sensor histidine kinase [Geobacter sp. SVR]GCF85397.1 two-component sensor histidine kinase [Geobacter sp. SVR]
MRPLRPSLTLSILAFLSCLLFSAWLLFSLFALKTAANDLYAQKAQHARMLLATFVNQLPETIPTFPESVLPTDSAAAAYVRKLAEDAGFVRLTLLDANGRCIFTAGREEGDIYAPFSGLPAGEGGSFTLRDRSGVAWVSQVLRSDAPAGRAGLILSLSAEQERLQRSRQLFTAYCAIDFILLLGFGSFILRRIVVRPVNRLLAATEKITDGHYGQRVQVSGSFELVRLAESFNAMSGTLLLKERQVTAHVAALEKANADLRQAREETLRSEKMASIGLLAAGMAHEIGTPLASIMGYAELLGGEEPNGATVHDYADRISRDCARIDRIVRGLLDYSRSRASSLETVDLGRLAAESIELLSRQGAFRHIHVSTAFEEGLAPVMADPHQLQQALINLMLNSRDALAEGGKLAIRGKVDNQGLSSGRSGAVRIEVLDNGSGIPAEHVSRIFDPFFTTKAPGKGTGLGLAIVARIIEGMGGRIAVKSRIGAGSCFAIWLPIAAEPAEEPQ